MILKPVDCPRYLSEFIDYLNDNLPIKSGFQTICNKNAHIVSINLENGDTEYAFAVTDLDTREIYLPIGIPMMDVILNLSHEAYHCYQYENKDALDEEDAEYFAEAVAKYYFKYKGIFFRIKNRLEELYYWDFLKLRVVRS